MKAPKPKFSVSVAEPQHIKYVDELCKLYEESAKKRGIGIAKRKPEYLTAKINEQKAIIALTNENGVEIIAGFCYVETWTGKNYVANSGLLVKEEFRKNGLAKKIKKFVFEYTRKKYPNSKIFGITTSLAVMKMNSDLGYKPVTYSELTRDNAFWDGCMSCQYYDVLTRTGRTNCLCTAMLFDPKATKKKEFVETIKKVDKKIPQKLKSPKAQRIREIKTAGKSKANRKKATL